jgi:hypothetical protein
LYGEIFLLNIATASYRLEEKNFIRKKCRSLIPDLLLIPVFVMLVYDDIAISAFFIFVRALS